MASIFISIAREDLDAALLLVTQACDAGEVADGSLAILLNRIRTRFLAEVDPQLQPWPQSEAARIRRGRGGTGTLFDTGQLFRSIQAAEDEGVLAQAVSASDDEFLATRMIGTDVPYAGFHNFGTKTLPRRSFMGANDDDMQVIEAYILRRIRRALNYLNPGDETP